MQFGGSLVALFEPIDVRPALDAALKILKQADETTAGVLPLRIAIGVARGELLSDEENLLGAALDRAQLLANRARPGELVLDADARNAASTHFLFERQVSAGAAPLKGHAVDRNQPHRAHCRLTLANLRPAPVSSSVQAVLASVEDRCSKRLETRVLLRGDVAAGGDEWIRLMLQRYPPAHALFLEDVPGGLAPLGSLRMMLLRQGASIDKALEQLGHPHEPILKRIASGAAVTRTEAIDAFRMLVSRLGEQGPLWLILSPCALIDPGTLNLVGALLRSRDIPCSLIARLPQNTRTPAALSVEHLVEITLPQLKSTEAREIAAHVLSCPKDGDVPRRIALLGNGTPLGVVEAARAMVAAGELVPDAEGFRWRITPRSTEHTVGVELLTKERLHSLDDILRRVLDIICLLPGGSPMPMVAAVAARDGIGENQLMNAVTRLGAEAFLQSSTVPLPDHELIRTTSRSALQPARRAELNRFIAAEMNVSTEASFAQALRGHYLAEAGLIEESVRDFLSASQLAAEMDFQRCSVRLAAASVQLDSSETTRNTAQQISQSIKVPSPTPRPFPNAVHSERPAERATGLSPPAETRKRALPHRAVHYLMSGDFDGFDRHMDVATAEGRNLVAISRLRAMSYLARGELAAAQRVLASNATSEGATPKATSDYLAKALVVLSSGDYPRAVRLGLKALCSARRDGDRRGEHASLAALARCYSALGRVEDAQKIGSVAAQGDQKDRA